MFQLQCRFTLVIADETGLPVHREEVEDFVPLYEDLLFRAILEDAMPNEGSLPPASLVPVFERGNGRRVAALKASLPARERTFGLGLFAGRAEAALAARNLPGGPAKPEARLTWHVEAYDLEHRERPRRLRSSRHRQPYPIVRAPLSAFGVSDGTREKRPVSLFVRRDVLESLREEAARYLEVERANVLLGHLVQEGPGAAAVVVSGRSPAGMGAGASRAHLEFTPGTFLAIRHEVGRRTDGAVIVGWAHNHPPTCGAACLQIVPACRTGMLFFSPQDQAVHRAAFPAPYMVGVVSGKDPGRRADEPGVRAFGWQDGEITQQPFQVFG